MKTNQNQSIQVVIVMGIPIHVMTTEFVIIVKEILKEIIVKIAFLDFHFHPEVDFLALVLLFFSS